MIRRLLAVKPQSMDYIHSYSVTAARSFEEAKAMILRAEAEGAPFDALDLPAYDRKGFKDFFNWMIKTNRKYPFSIFGYRGNAEFLRVREKARRSGIPFRD